MGAPDFVSTGPWACPCGFYKVTMSSPPGLMTTTVRCPHCGTTCELIPPTNQAPNQP